MFFGKKKEKKPAEKITFYHPLLGNVEYWDGLGWRTTTTYKFGIFNETYDLNLRMISDDSSSKFTEKQEDAIKKFLDSIDELQKSAENELSSFFKVDDPAALTEDIEIENVIVTKHGDICLSILSSFDDSICEVIPEDAIFDDSFGISVYPEVKILPSEGDYFDFKNRE